MANNIALKDANNATVVVKSTDNGGIQTPSHNVDTITNPLPVGTNSIGKVGIQIGGADVSNSNLVPVIQTGALPAGTNLIGKTSLQTAGSDVANGNPLPVSIQTAPAIAAGTNVIGKIGVQVGGVDVATGNPLPVSIQTAPAIAAGTNVIGKVSVQVGGADVAGGNPIPVVQTGALAAGENHVGKVGGQVVIASATVTRPADTSAYVSGDLLANSVTAASVVPMIFTAARVNDASFRIVRARLKKTGTSLTNASFRLHLYKLNPSLASGITNGDNGVWLTTESDHLGAIDITLDKAFSDSSKGIGTPNNGTEMYLIPTSGAQTIFGLLEVRAAYTPVSAEVFTVALEVIQD